MNIELSIWNAYMFQKFILTINFGFFRLPIRVWLITLTTLQDPFRYFYISDWITCWVFRFGFSPNRGFWILCQPLLQLLKEFENVRVLLLVFLKHISIFRWEWPYSLSWDCNSVQFKQGALLKKISWTSSIFSEVGLRY